METDLQVISFEQLEHKERDGREELLYQSIRSLGPSYWSGVRATEGGLYGAFHFHQGPKGEQGESRASFLLGEQGLLLAVLEDAGGLFW